MTLTAPAHSIRSCKTFSLTLLSIALLHSLAGYAGPAAPDAGQTLRELQKLPDLTPPQASPQLQIDQELHIEPELQIEKSIPDNTKDKKTNDGRFMVKTIHISGNSKIPTAELEALVAGLTGTEHDLPELNVAAARITAYYRAHGYAVARAYLPAQDIVDGAVSINIIEGHIAKHLLDNRSLLSDKSVNNILDQIKESDVIRTAQIDRTLRLLNDMPGVEGARASLQPGASIGTSDIAVELKPGAAYSGNVNLDNYGDRYIGAYRLGGTLHLNSPFKLGDQISLGALASDQHLAYERAAYQFPVGSNGLRLGVAYSDTRYHLGKEFTNLSAHGNAVSGSAFVIYPFIRSQPSNLSSTFTWEQKRLNDIVDSTFTITSKRARLMNLGLSGNHSDSLGGDSISNFDLSLALGHLDIQSPAALAADADAQTNGAYKRLAYTVNRQQYLASSNQLFFSLSGQKSSKNLDSSEKFSLGGVNGVRAYPQGEGVGDQGHLINLELRHNVSDALQGTLFYDTGSITVNHNPFGTPPAPNSLSLSGFGVGANANLAGTQIKISLAKRIGGEQPVSIPAAAVHGTTLWVQASEQF